ncbi:MAG: PilN domain-containing protein [Syntrophorhabdaceae bacterium]|nr:PilN domain-containing protein [Syntrophorhabdaceae bacterium]
MRIGPLTLKPAIEKGIAYFRAARAIVEPLCLRIWGVLNCNLVEGIILPERFLAVCVERGCVSAAAGERFLNRKRLTGSGRYAFEGDGFSAPDDLAAAASRAMKELGRKGSKVILGVPREWVVIRTAQMPSTVKENMGPVVTYEIDRLTPLMAADAMYDYVVGAEKDERVAITLMAARKERLSPCAAALTEKGLPPVRMSTPSVDMARLCGHLVGIAAFVFLHVDPHGYEGWFIEEGDLAGGFYGSCDPCGDEEDPRKRYENVRAALAEAGASDGSRPLCIVAERGAEAGDVLPDIAYRQIGDSEITSFLGGGQKNFPFAPAAMLHEALCRGPRTFDLARSGAGEKKRGPLVTSLVLASLLAMMLIPYVVVPLEIEKRKITAIEEQIRSRRKDVMAVERLKKEAEALQGELDGIEEFKKKKPVSLDVLKVLTLLLPKTVWLTRTRVTEDTAEIEGYAASATGVLSILEQSDLFRKVEFASPTMKDGRLNAERFVVRMELEGLKKQETKTEGTVKKDEKGK